MNLTSEQLHILRHTLGISDPRIKEPYRNRYAANHEDEKLVELARLGMMRLYYIDQEHDWYCCTEAGKAVALASRSAAAEKPV